MNIAKITIKTYISFLKNIPYLLKISWIWILLSATVLLLPPMLNFSIIYSIFFSFLILIFASPSITVAWHQKLLSENYPKQLIYLKINKNIVSYSFYLIAIFILTIILTYAFSYFFKFIIPNETKQLILKNLNYTYIKFFNLSFSFIIILTLYGLILPARALMTRDLYSQELKILTPAKKLPIFAILLLTSAPLTLINEPDHKIMNYINSVGNNFFLNKIDKLSPKPPNSIISNKSKFEHLKKPNRFETLRFNLLFAKEIILIYTFNLLSALLLMAALSHIYKELNLNTSEEQTKKTQPKE